MGRATHKGSIRKRGKSWQIRVSVGGQESAFTVRGSKKDAIQAAEAEHQKMTKRQRFARRGSRGRIRFSDLLNRFRTSVIPETNGGTPEAYEDTLKPVEIYFCGREMGAERGVLGPFTTERDPWVDDMLTPDFTDYLVWRRRTRLDGKIGPTSDRTVEKDRAVLHRLMKWAKKQGYTEYNPVVDTDRPSVDERHAVILSDPQFDAFLAATRSSRQRMLYAYAVALNDLGARSESEVLWLQWTDVDFDAGFVTVRSDHGHRTKTGRGRDIPMTPRLRHVLLEHAAKYQHAVYDGAGSPWVFHNTQDRGRAKAGKRISSMRNSFNLAAKKAGVPGDFVQHDLRHRRATTWLAAGKDLVKVQMALGHADVRTTMRYTHLVREHLLSLVEDADTPQNLIGELRALVEEMSALKRAS